MELTVRPWQLGKPRIASRYEATLACFPNLSLLDVTRDVTRQAAQLRASYRLRPTDAIQATTALVSRASLWVTNDRELTRLVSMLAVLVLEDLS